MSDDVRPFKPRTGRRFPAPAGKTATEVAANFEPYRLVQARHLAGLGRQDLAAAAGVAPWRIVQWESSVAVPVAYEVEKLAQVLDVPVGFFARGRPMAYLSAADVHFCGGDR